MNSSFRRGAPPGRPSLWGGGPHGPPPHGRILRAPRRVVVGAFLILCLNNFPVKAKGLEEEVRAMRIELRRLQQEVETLKEELRRRTTPVERVDGGSQGPQEKRVEAQEPAAAEVLPLLQ